MRESPYLLDTEDGPAVINFSGGRSSGMMLGRILEEHGGLPDDVEVVFCNTGAEREETLDFVRDCSVRWGVPITWLEYLHRPEAKGGAEDPKHWFQVVDHSTADRTKKPFESMIRWKKMLPNIAHSFCSIELKITPTRRYCRSALGWDSYTSVLGMRGDEPDRLNISKILKTPGYYPLALDGVTEDRVLEYWDRQPFNLALGRDEGNCTLCFKIGYMKLVRRIRNNPEHADWWISMENSGVLGTFSSRHTYAQLKHIAMNQGVLFDDADVDEEQSMPCFCGD